jgi:hypothetical protein
MLTQDYLKTRLKYDEKTGKFYWIFKQRKSKIAGHIENTGYERIMINGKHYGSHNLAWLYVYGELPKMVVDHINRNPLDNRICNLRLVTRSQNKQNQKLYKNNVSGFKGVHFCNHRKKWIASIRTNNKRITIGSFNDKEKAYESYCEYAKRLHTHTSIFEKDSISV